MPAEGPRAKDRSRDFAIKHWVKGSPLAPTAQVIVLSLIPLRYQPLHHPRERHGLSYMMYPT
jgi:hypothetical protein